MQTLVQSEVYISPSHEHIPSLSLPPSIPLSKYPSHLLADSLHCEISSRACAKAHNHAGANIVIDSLDVRTDK